MVTTLKDSYSIATAAPKLSGQQKALVIKLLGSYFTVTETIEILKNEYDIELTYGAVYWYWKHHHPAILEEREKFDKDVEILPITQKKYRLATRQKLVKVLEKHLWREKPLMRAGKMVVDKNGNAKIYKLTGNHVVINKLLDSAQKEMEPMKVELTDPTGDREFSLGLQAKLAKLTTEDLRKIANGNGREIPSKTPQE